MQVNFQNDIASKNIFDSSDKDLHADPNVINYKILKSQIISSMNCHMKKRLQNLTERNTKEILG